MADLGFSLGLFEIAYKEYKNLYDEIKKRDDFWAGLVIEKMIYCLLGKQETDSMTQKDLSTISDLFRKLQDLNT